MFNKRWELHILKICLYGQLEAPTPTKYRVSQQLIENTAIN